MRDAPTHGEAMLSIRDEGKARMSCLSERLPKGTDGAVQPKYGVAKLPGTKRYYDNAFKAVVEANGTEANFVTYLSGGWIGAVSTSCKNPDAAFELLGELGGPTGTTAVVSEPACGSGPWRGELLDAGRKSLWYPYGFSADQTDALIRAMRPYVATDLRNPVIGPRGPGIDKRLAALERSGDTELLEDAFGFGRQEHSAINSE